MITFVGGGPPRFYVTVDPQADAHNFAQIIINTTSKDYTDGYIKDVRDQINKNVAGARINVRKLNLGTMASGAPIAIRVFGKNAGSMRPIVQKIKSFLATQSQVLDIYDNWEQPAMQFTIDVDDDFANLAGVTNRNVAQTLNTFLTGQYLTEFREGDHKIPVFLRLPQEERDSTGPLFNFHVEGRVGHVPMDGISEMKLEFVDSCIMKWNQELCITVYAAVHEDELPNEVLKKVKPQLDKLQQEIMESMSGCWIEIGGEWEETASSTDNFNYAFQISFILIVLILVWQFNGLIKPTIILFTLPMGFAGSIIGLLVTGWPLNFIDRKSVV